MSIRPVKRLIKSKPSLEGAGVHLRRAFGFGGTSEFDPFLLLDDFRNDVPADYLAGFPWHPHRGIETITYVLAGTVEHGDSMGNRGVLRAVNRIAVNAQHRSEKPFGQIILAAADVDADTFRQLSAAYAEVASLTTLYVSERDRAVEASRWLHGFERAGYMPPTLVVPGIDTINVTGIDLTMLGHGFVYEARAVLTDMHTLIRRGTPPEQRFGLREATNEGGDRFWLIGA